MKIINFMPALLSCVFGLMASVSVVAADIPENDLYVKGSFTSWNANEEYKLIKDGSVFERKFASLPAGEEFKIGSEDWTYSYSSNQEMAADTEYGCEIGGEKNNMKLADELKNVTVRLDFSKTKDGWSPVISFITKYGDYEEPPLTVYMSFGQERLTRTTAGSREDPKVHFGLGDIDPAKDPDMTKVYADEPNSPLWKCDVPSDKLNNVGDVTFYFKAGDGKNYEYHIESGEKWDPDNWTRFIYYAEKMGDGQTSAAASQSFITFEQYDEAKKATKKYLYITGQGFKGLSNWAIRPGTGGVLRLESKRGVFYHLVEKPDNNDYANAKAVGEDYTSDGAKFKMSWLRPYDYYEKNMSYVTGDLSDKEKRCWATFNLGIVGMAESHEVFQGENPALKLIRGEGNSQNTEVFATPCRTIPCNNYNQSDWFVRKRWIENDGTKQYYLIVDIEDDCQTVTFAPFYPNPTITANGLTVEPVEKISYDDARKYHDAGSDRLAAEAVNGMALLTDLNIATATATFEAPTYPDRKGTLKAENQEINYEYNVDYELFADGVKSGEFAGTDLNENNKATLALEGIAIGDGTLRDAGETAIVALGVRARYTDAKTNLHFHSLMVDGTMTTDVTFPVPDISIDAKSFAKGDNYLDDDTDPRYTLGAYANVNVTVPETEYNWCGDFLLSTDGDAPLTGGEIVCQGHKSTDVKGGVVPVPLTDYTPWNETGAYSDDNNWAAKLRGAEKWPLYLPDVVEVHRKYTDNGEKAAGFTEDEIPDVTVGCSIRAVYPFVYNPDAKIQVAAANAPKAPRSAPARKLDSSVNYRVSLHSVDVALPITLTASSDLTGKVSIMAGQTDDALVEYYNLQGVRVYGEPAPGLYIRRQGCETSKVVIR